VTDDNNPTTMPRVGDVWESGRALYEVILATPQNNTVAVRRINSPGGADYGVWEILVPDLLRVAHLLTPGSHPAEAWGQPDQLADKLRRPAVYDGRCDPETPS
jgi:hypothetical protein